MLSYREATLEGRYDEIHEELMRTIEYKHLYQKYIDAEEKFLSEATINDRMKQLYFEITDALLNLNTYLHEQFYYQGSDDQVRYDF